MLFLDDTKITANAVHPGFVASNFGREGDMGSLIAILDSLDRYSLENGRPVTLPLLKAALQPELSLGKGAA